MSDLLLEEFGVVPNDALGELLSKEKKKIFGGEEFHAREKENNGVSSAPTPGSTLLSKEPGGRDARN
jgi:hypothetical protein